MAKLSVATFQRMEGKLQARSTMADPHLTAKQKLLVIVSNGVCFMSIWHRVQSRVEQALNLHSQASISIAISSLSPQSCNFRLRFSSTFSDILNQSGFSRWPLRTPTFTSFWAPRFRTESGTMPFPLLFSLSQRIFKMRCYLKIGYWLIPREVRLTQLCNSRKSAPFTEAELANRS